MNTTQLSITMVVEPEILAYLKECGPSDWGMVRAKPDDEHVKDFASSLHLTREHFKQKGDVELHGLYMTGTDTVMAHTGTSPAAAIRARILAGLWNAFHAQVISLSDGTSEPQRAEG